jgi:hypothetical protein
MKRIAPPQENRQALAGSRTVAAHAARLAACILAFLDLPARGLSQTNAPAPAAATPAPAPAPAPSALAAAVKTWADAVTVKGDVRYRYEEIKDDAKLNPKLDPYTRQRDRIRARLGAEAKCTDNLKAGIEISTGQSDPVSGNQSLGDGSGKKDFRLNLAYFDYSLFGDSANEVHAVAGKMKNPFIAQPDDLVWDPDLTPEGLALKGQLGGRFVTLYGNAGYLWVQEREVWDDLVLYGGQTAVRIQFIPEIALTLGASYYDYVNLQGWDVIDWESKNNAYGNATVDGTVSGSTTNRAWAAAFTPAVGFAQLDLWLGKIPLALFAQELRNAKPSWYNEGHLYGVTVGKARNPRTWEVGYSFAELQRDATVGMFTDSDRWGGGTDGKGHKFYAKYQIVKNFQLGVTYFRDEKKLSDPGNEKDYERLQVDLLASF